MNKKTIYWLCQILGWFFWSFLSVFLYGLTAQVILLNHLLGEAILVIVNILVTQLIRMVLIRFGWLALDLKWLIPRALAVVFCASLLNYAYVLAYSYWSGEVNPKDFMLIPVLTNIITPLFAYSIWVILYLTFHYFENYNKSLKYEAAAREIELKNLRSQLNPHFIFNALNSIRALVDEDPVKSKSAITQLSNILRNSLMVDRQRLIPFSEEMITVKDYLALESIRYEERLRTVFSIDPASNDFLIPPLMIQTLVENGIKHGIANLKHGGEIRIESKVNDDKVMIQLRNSGHLNADDKPLSTEGFGLNNTKKRLELIYGAQASFSIKNEDHKTVLTEIVIPRSL